MPFEETDSTHVVALKRSFEQVGCLGKILIEKGPRPGTILSGKHRKDAIPNWPSEEIEVRDDLHRELIMVHANIQRRVSDEETAARLLRIAKILESQGVPKSDVCAKISGLVPFSSRWIRELLPDEYKHVEMQRRPAEVLPQTARKLESSGPPLSNKQKVLLQPFKPTVEQEYPFEDCLCKSCPRQTQCSKR